MSNWASSGWAEEAYLPHASWRLANVDSAEKHLVTLLEGSLEEPLLCTTPTLYSIVTGVDLFDDRIPDAYLNRIFDTIRQSPQHRFQIITKREQRLASFFSSCSVPENVWLGVSVENRRDGIPRVKVLQKIDAAHRLLSCEPLEGSLGKLNLDGIDWVIVGNPPTNNSIRKQHAQWAVEIRQQCDEQHTGFYYKQSSTQYPGLN